MITKDRLRQFISWYQSVAGCVSHHELTWFVKSVEEYLQPTNDADVYTLVLEARQEAEKWRDLYVSNTTDTKVHLPWEFNTLNSFFKCEKCDKNPASEPHPCPYAEEIDDDHTTLCTCCDECTEECAMDI